jgi:hypothetical protein
LSLVRLPIPPFGHGERALLVYHHPCTITLPAPKAVIDLAVAGNIKGVESVTKGQTVTYEAVIAKGLKKSEVVVAADGSIQK